MNQEQQERVEEVREELAKILFRAPFTSYSGEYEKMPQPFIDSYREYADQILSHPKICVLDDSIDIVPEPSLLVDKLQIFLGKYKDAIKYGHTNTMTSTWALDLERLLIKANFRKVIREQQVGT